MSSTSSSPEDFKKLRSPTFPLLESLLHILTDLETHFGIIRTTFEIDQLVYNDPAVLKTHLVKDEP